MIDQHSISSLTDSDLISRYKESGDKVLVGALYERYMHLVFGVCMKYFRNEEDSHDATIDIFEKLMEDLQHHEVTYFKGWLFSVAKNHCLMKLRKDKNRKEELSGTGEELTAVMESGEELHLEEVPELEEKLTRMEEAVLKLPAEQKRCIELFYLEEKSYQEIMRETGCNFKQVKSFIQNGKRNLKIILSSHHE